MATRAATFNAKLRNLKDYHYRTINNITPLPSGVDIANTLKFFSQTLMSVLKDVPCFPVESSGPRQRDSVRLSVFPNLNYAGLYQCVVNIIDTVPMVQYGQTALGEAVLNVIGCLVPFLEYDLLDSLPYTVASTLATFPACLHKDTIDLLYSNLLPMTLGCSELQSNSTYACESCAAIIMMVFQYVENKEYHSKLIECLMSLKKDIAKDLLMVIAYGPPQSRAPAANLLLYYWPQLNPAIADRRGTHHKYSAWKPITCQRAECTNAGNSIAVKMCMDPALAIDLSDKPPPLYLCVNCVDTLRRRNHPELLADVLQPMDTMSLICENKNCKNKEKTAVCTCFSIDCASFNGNKPIRYCEACHLSKHKDNCKHVIQKTIPQVWDCEPEMQSYLVEGIVSLLKEAQPLEEKRVVEMGEEHISQHHFEEEEEPENEEDDEQKLMSRYGVWLLVELCKITDDIPVEILGRLLAMLFQWFDATAYLPDDNVGNALERLKPEYIYNWLQDVSKNYLEVILSCLLPHPVEYARVGGHWDTLSSRTSQIKEGLNRLFCLIPYDIVTFNVWDYVMPYWLEAIRTEIPEDELPELKVLLSKMFDTDMCPLPFSVEKMYQFISERFDETTASVQEQSLLWLQILSSLDIIVPLQMMVRTFRMGVQSLIDLQKPAEPGTLQPPLPPPSMLSPATAKPEDIISPLTPDKPQAPLPTVDSYEKESELNLKCFIYMLDVSLKQAEIQEAPRHQSIFHETSKDIMLLLTKMMEAPWEGKHLCEKDADKANECEFCQSCALFLQLCCQAVEFIAPRDAVKLPEKELPKVDDITKGDREKLKHSSQSHNRAIPITPCQTEKEENEEEEEEEVEEPPNFILDQLPSHLQLIHALLKELCDQKDKDAIFHLLTSLKLLCLHAECLNYAAKDNEEFVCYCLRKMLIPNLWKLLGADLSHIAAVAVPLLLHCLTLPSGSDVFWKLVENDFTSEDWKLRYAAVEKVTVLARLLDAKTIKNNQPILTALAHAFCYLVGSLDDINAAVAQRTMLYLETIKSQSLKCMCMCLEYQFDSVIQDRCMILQRMYELFTLLKNERILTWEFFLNRFDTLSLEAQLDLESNGDIAYPTDLVSSNRDSEHFLRKLNRARFALARTDSVRSVCESIMGKPPYRRACSVPLHLVAKTTVSPVTREKEKSYIRQQSAPQFNLSRRRQSSFKFGMGMFGNYMFPESTTPAKKKGGHLREFTDEESNFAALLQRAMDLEGIDRETVHQLVTLLMKFMSHNRNTEEEFMACEASSVSDERQSNKAQSIVIRHLNVLLGYNQTEKAFSVPPFKLRCSTVFNAFLSGLPSVLDRNFTVGNNILPFCLALLQYAASPQRYATDYQPPNYTLWLLEPHTRLTWLSTLLVSLYKYQYNQPPLSTCIHTLIRIVMNTIDAQHHRCRRHDDAFGPSSPIIPRNRDTSNVSVGDLENIQETETPPQSPTDSQLSSTDAVTINVSSPSHSVQYMKLQAASKQSADTDNDSSPPSIKASSVKKKVTRQRPPRRLPDYSLPQETSLQNGHAPKNLKDEPEEIDLIKMESPIDEMKPESMVDSNFKKEDNSTVIDIEPDDNTESDTQDKEQQIAKTLQQCFEEHIMDKGRREEKAHNRLSSDLDPSSRESSEQEPASPTPPRVPLRRDLHKHQRPASDHIIQSVKMRLKDDLPLNPNHGPESPIFRSVQRPHSMIEPHELAQNVENEPAEVDEKMAQQIEEFECDRAKRESSVYYDAQEELTDDNRSSVSRSSVPKDIPEASEQICKDSKSEVDEKAVESSAESMTGRESKPDSDQTYTTASDSPSDRLLLNPNVDKAQAESEVDDSPIPSPGTSPHLKPNFRQRKSRKTGLTTVELQKLIPELANTGPPSGESSPAGTSVTGKKSRRNRKADLVKNQQAPAKKATAKFADNVIMERCPECHAVLETYDDEVISNSIVCLATYIHREPALATPLLLEMLQAVSRISSSSPYSWQAECNSLIIPGNSVSVARQFLRCTLHQLTPNGLFVQLFQSKCDEPEFFKTIASALVDFTELNAYAPLLLLLEGLNNRKNLPADNIMLLLENLASYMDCITLETPNPQWQTILTHFDAFFRKLVIVLPNPCETSHLMKIMISVFRIPGLQTVKGILEPFSKILTFVIQNCTFKLQQLFDLCSLCNGAFSKERDKLLLTRCVIYELVSALKFKSILPDENLLMLVQFVCIDAGGTIGPTNIVEGLNNYFNPQTHNLMSTNAAECMRQHLTVLVEFIADLHTINRVKSNMKGGSQNLNEDTLGSQLKSAIAQFVALGITKRNRCDYRAVNRYLPWLYHPPSAMQQGPKEFIECVGHIRLLSWILLGSLTHTAVTHQSASITCQPIPLEASQHISDHVMVIMTGFAEKSKESVLHMSSLFHAFILCQLWTMYCESAAQEQPGVDESTAMVSNTIMDFWGRVTPGVLQLLSHSKVLAEMVNLHFLSLMEALQECNSTVLAKLFALWTPILFTYHSQLPGHLQVRLQTCQNWEPPKESKDSNSHTMLLKWLKRLQFKLGQIEVQSSAAIQFYTV
ncbi:protein unc-79 homolog [Tubulanus polymorphus]|uniref:protein unc-79 homolog n=1 Tax=Tubulanus polymorphus TaxID=672921 RepID=UPI003DA5E480